jgi:hypothetical protein
MVTFEVKEKELTKKQLYDIHYRRQRRLEIREKRKQKRKEKQEIEKKKFHDFVEAETMKMMRKWLFCAQLDLSNLILKEAEIEMESVTDKKTERGMHFSEWSFSCGYTSNAKCFNEFKENPHNIKEGIFLGLGICKTDPENKKLPEWKKRLWRIGKRYFETMIPEFASGEFVIHFSKMSSSEHYISLHTDDRDISHQYVVYFGDWTGAKLVCYDEMKPASGKLKNLTVAGEFEVKNTLIQMEGRKYHQVAKQDYNGTRFAMICYQSWNSLKTKPDPILDVPRVLKLGEE